MLDAVRICGRWVSQHVLARLSGRSLTSNPPARRSLVRDFCRALNWRNAKGQLCLASANVALNRLEKQGLVTLPPPTARGPRSQPRQLRDDGEPLPPLPPRALRTHPLRLQLIEDQHDPNHRRWNRLIIREHPLQAAPLFGPQLRYLIRAGDALIGAFGVGPASFRLECRDQWIGWDGPTRQGNLPQLIGLSRFLIRPGLRWPNLASRCYALLLGRVAADWQARYQVKPVLLETFVDRSTQTGTSLSAANWRRLGQSSGRGRSSPSPKVRPKTPKDVWVYQLDPKARELLLRRPISLMPPRSVFHGLQEDHWIDQELDGLDLGSARLERRFALMLSSRWKNPHCSFYRSFGSAAAGKAAYRLIANPQAEVNLASLLAPHQLQTQRRMAAESVIVLAQDTSALSYNTLLQTPGLGPVGDDRNPGRGLWLHSLHAFRTDGIPLGCCWAQLWARSQDSDTGHRNEQSIDQKESLRWLLAYQAAARMAQAMPQTHLVVSGDRESDIFELYDHTQTAPPNLHLLVRAQHDRLLTPGHKLWQQLQRQPLGGRLKVRGPRRKDRPARQAVLEVRWAALQAAPPRVALKKSWSAGPLYALIAREVDPPQGVEPIEWVLLTDWKIDCFKMAVRLIKWYGLRWGIECWHQVLKDVCRVEKRQMESATTLERALVLDMIVAWRTLMLCRLGRKPPDLPASLYYDEQELAVLEVYKNKIPPARSPRAEQPHCEAATPPQVEGQGRAPGQLKTRPQPSCQHACPRHAVPSDSISSQSARGDAGRLLGTQVRWTSRRQDPRPRPEDPQRACQLPPPHRSYPHQTSLTTEAPVETRVANLRSSRICG